MDAETLIADGWKHRQSAGFTGQLGQLWICPDDPSRGVGMIVTREQCNNHIGTLHGGAVMTLADVALGYGVTTALDGFACVTISLQAQFVATARIGDFVVCRSEVIRRSKHLVFMRGLITTGETTIATADGIWKVIAAKADR